MPVAKSSPNPQGTTGTRTLVTVLLLIFILPIGVIVMWAWSRWAIWVKGVLTALAVPVLLVEFSIFSVALLAIANPSETAKVARDTARLADIEALKAQIEQVKAENPTGLCGVDSTPCAMRSYPKEVSTSNIDGSGWIKIDFSEFSSELTKLPIDPVNDQNYFYIYCSDGKDWELVAPMESKKLAAKATGDGGIAPNLYEIGSKLNLCKR